MADKDTKDAAAQAAAEDTAAAAAAAEQAKIEAAAAEAAKSGQPVSDEGVHSSSKTEQQAAEQQAAGVVGGPVVLDHGEESEEAVAEREAIQASATDPWGTTPAQMRDVHDEAVDPAKVGVATRPDGSGLQPLDGIAPDTVEDHPKGTLPPVG